VAEGEMETIDRDRDDEKKREGRKEGGKEGGKEGEKKGRRGRSVYLYASVCVCEGRRETRERRRTDDRGFILFVCFY
jgi:hypothetical protein